MMPVSLVHEKKKGKPRRIDLRQAQTVVGRQDGCDVRIPSAEVSRRHCLFLVGKNKVVVEDLSSVNGTYVNDVAIIGKEELRPGDRVHIGPVTFVVEFSPVPEEVSYEGDQPAAVISDAAEAERLELVEDDIEIVEDEEEIPEGEIVLDDEEPWMLPEADDMRGILTQLTDSDHPTQPKKP